MDKKSTNRKVIIPYIISERAAGKTDREIYQALTEEYFDKKTIALIITGTATEEAKRKYANWNIALLVLLGFGIVSKILAVIAMTKLQNPVSSMIFLYFACGLNVYLIYAISRFRVDAYVVCAVFSFLAIMHSLQNLQGDTLLIDVISSTIIGLVAWYLKVRLFPNYSGNKMKKDETGDFIVEKKMIIADHDNKIPD